METVRVNGNEEMKPQKDELRQNNASEGGKRKGNKTKWRPVPLDAVVHVNNRDDDKRSSATRRGGRRFTNRGPPTRGRGNFRSNRGAYPTDLDVEQNWCIGYAPVFTRYPPVRPPPLFLGFPSNESLQEAIRKQIEYYFSEENLAGDIFLRLHMDPEGYVALDLIATFNRMKLLSQDVHVIAKALEGSECVEVDPSLMRVRARNSPHKWPISSNLNPEAPPFVPGVP